MRSSFLARPNIPAIRPPFCAPVSITRSTFFIVEWRPLSSRPEERPLIHISAKAAWAAII